MDLVRNQWVQTLCGQKINNKGLAEASHISTSYLSLILNGHRRPTAAILKKMAHALGVDVVRLERELKKRNGQKTN